jgi:phage terminase small subunit
VSDQQKKLTAKQELFCREYIIDLNAAQASLRAGYSEKTAGVIGAENLSKPILQARIAELMASRAESIDIDAKYVLNRLVQIDQMDVADILNDDFSMKPLREWPKSWRTTLSGLDVQSIASGDAEVSIIKKIKWPDKVKNLELLGRHVNIKAFEKEQESTGMGDLASALHDLINQQPN